MLQEYTRMAKTSTIPLAIDVNLHREIKRGAKKTGLSQADVMRHSIRLGLPTFVERFPMPSPQGKQSSGKRNGP
jgi:hypothetical protein